MTDAVAGTPVTPMRPLGVAEILDGAVRAVRRNARASFAMSVPLAIVRTGLVATMQLAAVNGSTGTASLQLLGQLLISGLFGTILTGLLAPVFTGELLGRRCTASQALAQVGRAGFGLAILALVVAVAEEVGLVVLVIGGAWLWGIWAVAAPALVIERTGVRGALGRSFDLVKDEYWRTWGIRTLRWLLTTVLGLFVALPFTLLAAYLTGTNLLNLASTGIDDPSVYVTIVAIGNLVSVAITSPISAAVDTLLYTDLRMRREGMDIVLTLPPIAPETMPGIAGARPAVTAW